MSKPRSKRADDRPAMMFYPKDWLNDNDLRVVSLAARGLWIDILCRMWSEKPRGTITGDVRRLARIVGEKTETVADLVDELIAEGVAEYWADGDFYPAGLAPAGARIASRRMLRDFQKERELSTIRATAGRKGGQAKRRNTASKTQQTVPSASNGTSKTTTKPESITDIFDSGLRDAENERGKQKTSKTQSKPSLAFADPYADPNTVYGSAENRSTETVERIAQTARAGPLAPANASDAELVEMCYRLEQNPQGEKTIAHWVRKLAALQNIPNGRAYLVELLENVQNAGDPVKGCGELNNPAAYVEQRTHQFIKTKGKPTQ